MSPSTRTFGRYDLLLELSKGPFGSLWIARPGAGSRDVVLLRRLPETEPIAAAARWAVSARGTGLLEATEFVNADAEVGLVTRYHPGEPLRSLLRLASFKRRAFVPGAALRVALDALGALESLGKAPAPPNGVAASNALLPDSIVVGTDGRSLAIDVGIGAMVRRDPTYATLADIAAYLAPEELESAPKTDERTSVFSLGVLLWEMMSGGRRLFYGTTQDAIAERVKTAAIPRLDASRPPGGGPIPKLVADLVARALERDPERRFESLGAMRKAIEGLGSEWVGTATEVSAIVSALAGNALTARDRSIERAMDPNAAPEPDVHAKADERPQPQPNAAAASTGTAQTAKRTLLGIAPAKPSRMPSVVGTANVKAETPAAASTPVTETPKPVTPPLPEARKPADSSPELTPITAARLSGLKPPKPASKLPKPDAETRSVNETKSVAKAKPAPESNPAASLNSPPNASHAAPDDDAPPSEDRRLLDALTREPTRSERTSSSEPSRTASKTDERDSVTPPESLTASKDSAPPERRVPAAPARGRRWIGYSGAAALLAIALYAVFGVRRASHESTSEPAASSPAEVTPASTAPAEGPTTAASVAAAPAVETPLPQTTASQAPSASTPPEPAAAPIAEPTAKPETSNIEPPGREPTSVRHTATPTPATRHAVTPKPRKTPKFTPSDI